MKLEIYEDTKPAMEPPVFLRLKKHYDGIEVVAVDADGNTHEGGHLLTFKENGSVFMQSVVNSTLGFDLGGLGQIKTI